MLWVWREQADFGLLDEKPEEDEGYVTLVNAKEKNDGVFQECKERTGVWAWKHPHPVTGTVTYTRLTGDVRFFDVDLPMILAKTVLHNIDALCETWTEGSICRFDWCRKDYHYQSDQSFL